MLYVGYEQKTVKPSNTEIVDSREFPPVGIDVGYSKSNKRDEEAKTTTLSMSSVAALLKTPASSNKLETPASTQEIQKLPENVWPRLSNTEIGDSREFPTVGIVGYSKSNKRDEEAKTTTLSMSSVAALLKTPVSSNKLEAPASTQEIQKLPENVRPRLVIDNLPLDYNQHLLSEMLGSYGLVINLTEEVVNDRKRVKVT